MVKYRKFRELNKLVETRYKTIGMIVWVSICMIAKMWWLNFLHWANNAVEHIDKKTVVVSYMLNGKMYKIVTRPRRGPTGVLLICEGEEDVSDLVMPFMGPNDDWHGFVFTPTFWGKESLTFYLSSGEQKTFSKEEPIQL
jgi:hypothetical protein